MNYEPSTAELAKIEVAKIEIRQPLLELLADGKVSEDDISAYEDLIERIEQCELSELDEIQKDIDTLLEINTDLYDGQASNMRAPEITGLGEWDIDRQTSTI